MIKVSAAYLTYQNYVTYNDSSTMVMRKGFDGTQAVSVLTNAGSTSSNRSFTLTKAMTGFNSGDLVIDVISCNEGYVDSDGNMLITRVHGLPAVYYAKANIQGSDICVNGTTLNPSPVKLDPTSTSTTMPAASTSQKSSGSRRVDLAASMMVLFVGCCAITTIFDVLDHIYRLECRR